MQDFWTINSIRCYPCDGAWRPESSSFAKHLLAPLAFIPRAWPRHARNLEMTLQNCQHITGRSAYLWQSVHVFWCWKSVISMQQCLFTQWYLPHFHCFSKQRFCARHRWRNIHRFLPPKLTQKFGTLESMIETGVSPRQFGQMLGYVWILTLFPGGQCDEPHHSTIQERYGKPVSLDLGPMKSLFFMKHGIPKSGAMFLYVPARTEASN